MPRLSVHQDYTVFSTDYFSSHVRHTKTKTLIIMRVFTKDVHTGKMLYTLPLLKQLLPTILKSTCFNEGNIPFKVEVMRTELGHLFEHILLEYLCQLKLSKGHKEVMFSGTTDWNWNKYPRGTFQISISVGKEDLDIFPEAFYRTATLFKLIMEKHMQNSSSIASVNKKEAAVTLPL